MTPDDLPFPFLVGHTDAGLDALRSIFSGHPDVTVPPPAPFLVRMITRRPEFERADGFDLEGFLQALNRESTWGPWGIDEDAARALLADAADVPGAFRALYRHAAAEAGTTRYADATPIAVRQIAALAYVFPEARFVHVIEDPRHFCARMFLRDNKTLSASADAWRQAIEAAVDARATLGPMRYAEFRLEESGDLADAVRAAAERLRLGLDPDGFTPVTVDAGKTGPLSPRETRAIERMAADAMSRVGFRRRTAARQARHTERLRRIGEERSGGRPGGTMGEAAVDAAKRLAQRAPALGKVLRTVQKAAKR